MKLENQVTSLELSKKLKELGVKQNSLFIWYFHNGLLNLTKKKDLGEFWENNQFYSAFTVAELGEMLPKGFYSFKDCDSWSVLDFEDNEIKMPFDFGHGDIQADTEANARAKLLIYLLENGLYENTN